jgi:succinoglycan biosynthesis transport protein ExoP
MSDVEPHRPAYEDRDAVGLDTAPTGGAHSDVIDIAVLVAAFRRRFELFAYIVAVIFLVSLLITIGTKSIYTATARVAINTQLVNVAPTSVSGTANAPVVSSIPGDSAAVDTEVAIIGSRRVAERVVSSLHLDKDPEFSRDAKRRSLLGSLKHAAASLFGHFGSSGASNAESMSPEDYAIIAVLSRLDASRVNLTNAIDISYSDGNPAKAAAISNAFAQAYIDDQIVSKFETSEKATSFLKDRLDDMMHQYLTDETKLQEYKIAHNLMSSGATTLTEQEISTYNQTLAQAKADAAADEANLTIARDQLARGSTGGDVGEALSSGVIGSLRAQRATISAHVADLEGRYGDKYPELIDARRQLADVDQQIQAEINRVISNLEAKADASRQRLGSIEGTLSSTKQTLAENNEAQVGLNQLQQNADASQALYQSYLDRLKEASAQEGGEQADARILSPAATPTAPSRPVVWLNLMLGLVLGVGAGLLAIFVSEMLDSGMETAADVERRLGKTYLGGIPLLSSLDGASVDDGARPRHWAFGRLLGWSTDALARMFPRASQPAALDGDASPVNDIVSNPHSAFAESFRNLKAAISYAFPHAPPQVVAITSALPKEGKTTVAICLARSAALQGVRTVLVDCDIRRRGFTRIVADDPARPGLVEVLSGSAKLAEALVADESSGATVLPIKKADWPTKDLFGSKGMDNILADLRSQFEFIVLDAPPLLPVADARVIATKADAVVVVAKWRETSAEATKLALLLLPRDQVKLAGVTLNQVDMKMQSQYGYGDPGFYYAKYKDYYG